MKNTIKNDVQKVLEKYLDSKYVKSATEEIYLAVMSEITHNITVETIKIEGSGNESYKKLFAECKEKFKTGYKKRFVELLEEAINSDTDSFEVPVNFSVIDDKGDLQFVKFADASRMDKKEMVARNRNKLFMEEISISSDYNDMSAKKFVPAIGLHYNEMHELAFRNGYRIINAYEWALYIATILISMMNVGFSLRVACKRLDSIEGGYYYSKRDFFVNADKTKSNFKDYEKLVNSLFERNAPYFECVVSDPKGNNVYKVKKGGYLEIHNYPNYNVKCEYAIPFFVC